MLFKYILFVSLFLLLTSEAKTNKNSCQYWELEDHLGFILGHFALPEYDWPEGEQDMTRWCKEVKKEKKIADQFLKNCTVGLAKTVTSSASFAGAKLSKLACLNNKERQNYIGKGKCGNEGKEGTVKCWIEGKSITTNIQLLKNPKDKIPTMCCAYLQIRKCILNTYKTIGQPICTMDNIKQLDGQLEKLAAASVDTICPYLRNPGWCDKYNKLINTTSAGNQYRTVFPPAIQVMESI